MGNGKKEEGITVRKREPQTLRPWSEEMEGFFGRPFPGFGLLPWRPSWRQPWMWRDEKWAPEIDVLEKEGGIIVRADLPGMKREDIDVAVEGDMLVIRGKRQEETEVKEKNYYCSERAFGEFSRSISLPEGVNADAIQAKYQDGVLEVTIQTPTAPKTKSIKVQVA